MDTQDKIKFLLLASRVPRETKKILQDMLDRQALFGFAYSEKQIEMVERFYLGIAKTTGTAPGSSGDPQTKFSHECKCLDCGDSGNLFVRNRKTGYSGVFRCHCETGRSRPIAHGPVWNDEYTESWVKEPKYTHHAKNTRVKEWGRDQAGERSKLPEGIPTDL